MYNTYVRPLNSTELYKIAYLVKLTKRNKTTTNKQAKRKTIMNYYYYYTEVRQP